MSSWIDDVLDACEDAETPRNYLKWSCLVSIAAVSAPNVKLDMQYYTIRPNIYCILVGDSGIGKNFPIDLAKDLVRLVDTTRVIDGRNSIQALIQELGRAETRKGKPMIPDARALFGANEFANFCIEDPQALTILTDLYDNHRMWKNTLKGSGVDFLKNVSVTLFGGAAPVHLKQVVPENAIGGGFLGRTIIVNEDKRAKFNSLINKKKRTRVLDKEKLAKHLIEVSKLEGDFEVEEQAQDWFDSWYIDLRKREEENKDRQEKIGGLRQRFHVHVLKVAMLLSMAERLDKVLTQKHIEDSLEICKSLITGAHKAFLGTGKSPLVHQTSLCIQYMLKHNNQASRQKLLTTFWGEFDAQDLDRISGSMMNAGAWTMESVGKDIIYRMSDEFAKIILEKENK